MSDVANLYDNGPISPIAKIHENLGVLTEGGYKYFNIDYIEGLPRSRPMIVDMVVLTGGIAIPAYSPLNAQLVKAIQPGGNDTKKEFLHLRWQPLDDVEGFLFELANQGRWSVQGAQASVSKFTQSNDPYLASTTFFVIGVNKDAQISAYNPNPVALPRARFIFWGYRYLITPVDPSATPKTATLLPATAATY